MDVNQLRAISTLLLFLVFIGIIGFALSRKRRAAFDEAAQLPFLDELPHAADHNPPGDRP